MMPMRDPQRIPDVLSELARTWEAQPDVTLAHVWAQLEARGVALNSSDVEVVEALRAVRRDFPLSLSFPDATSDQPACVLIETEGPVRRVSLNFVGDEAWIVVRAPRTSGKARGRGGSSNLGEEPQPGVWQVSELVKCQAGLPLQAKDLDGITHRLGVIRQIRLMESETSYIDAAQNSLDGTTRDRWPGETYLVQLADATTVLIGQTLRMWEQYRREVYVSAITWTRLDSCTVGSPLELTDAAGVSRKFNVITRILRAS